MTLFAIRDDDTSGWTDAAELDSVYRDVWERGIPVSFAVIPESVRSFHRGDRNRFYQTEETAPIHENVELVDYLKARTGEGQAEIMLHGFNHLYRVSRTSRSPSKPATKPWLDELREQTPGRALAWHGEFKWKDAATLRRETHRGKSYLSSLLGCRVGVFVPPSNQIGSGGIRAVISTGLNLSGVMGRGFDRPLTPRYLLMYSRRWAFRLVHGRPYPYVIDLGTHRELMANALTPQSSHAALFTALEFCRRMESPFVLATHYWDLATPALHDTLLRMCDQALRLGYQPALVTECFGRQR